MASKADFQALIDVLQETLPSDFPPLLKRVARCQMIQYDEETVGGQWEGNLYYSPHETRFTKGGFHGGLQSAYFPSHIVQLFLTVSDTDAWAGLTGPYIPAGYSEDVHLGDTFTNDTTVLTRIGPVGGDTSHFSLILSPSYFYAG